jgi:hypothetical protein
MGCLSIAFAESPAADGAGDSKQGLDGQRFARCVLFFAFPQGNMAQIY